MTEIKTRFTIQNLENGFLLIEEDELHFPDEEETKWGRRSFYLADEKAVVAFVKDALGKIYKK